MKKFYFLFTAIFFTAFAHAQVNVDSLRAITGSKRPYEEKINASLKILENFELKNFDSTIKEGNKALELARKNTDSSGVAEIKRHIAVAGYAKGKYDVAAKNYRESIAILEKSNDKKKLAPVYNELGKLYRETKDLNLALQNYSKADTLFRQLKDTGGITLVLN